MRSVSDLNLERFLVDDLDPAEQARIGSVIAADVELQRFIATRRASQEDFRNHAPAQRLPLSTPSLWTRLISFVEGLQGQGLVLAGSAACVVLFLAVAGRGPDEDSIRVRGGADEVTLAVQREGQVFIHRDQPLRAGDAVRLGAGPPGAFVVIVSVDHRGVASVLRAGVRVDADHWVPGSLVLDDSEGPERWFVATAETPIDAAALVAAIRRSGSSTASENRVTLGPAFAGVTLRSVAFEKEPRP